MRKLVLLYCWYRWVEPRTWLLFYEGILKHTAVIPFRRWEYHQRYQNRARCFKNTGWTDENTVRQCVERWSQSLKYLHHHTWATGMACKEISVKNLANIIQARMEWDHGFRCLPSETGWTRQPYAGGIILTGGGSQLKHLIQLTGRNMLPVECKDRFPERAFIRRPYRGTGQTNVQHLYQYWIKYNDYENKTKQLDQKLSKLTAKAGIMQQEPAVEKLLKRNCDRWSSVKSGKHSWVLWILSRTTCSKCSSLII